MNHGLLHYGRGFLHMHDAFGLNLDGRKAPGGIDTCGAHVLVVHGDNQRECGSGRRIRETIDYLHIFPCCAFNVLVEHPWHGQVPKHGKYAPITQLLGGSRESDCYAWVSCGPECLRCTIQLKG